MAEKCNGKGYIYKEHTQANAPNTFLPSHTTFLEKVNCNCGECVAKRPQPFKDKKREFDA